MASGDHGVLEALRTLQSVFSIHGPTVFADLMRELIQLFESGNPAFESKIASGEIWGGAGSVADNLPPSDTIDQQRYLQAMILLADYINDQQIGPEPIRHQAEWIASAFRQWLAHQA